jgi:LuxR family maltose regulon positive regulatory protein
MGCLLYERNNLAEAERHLLEGIRLSEQAAELGVLIVGYSTLAWLKLAQGEAQTALGVLQRAELIVQGYPDSDYWLAQLADQRAWLWLVQGNFEAAQQWAERDEPDPENKLSYLREVGRNTRARLLIAQAKPDQAIARLTSLRLATADTGRTGHLIETLALLALAYQAQGDGEHSLALLQQALALAEPEGYQRLFLDEGTSMAALLRQAARHGIASEYIDKLLAAFAEGESMAQRKPQLPPSLLIEPLSERELEILRLMAEGMSNQEIAQKIIVTVGTVKWHLNNIYGKLDVRSRTQALARAREFGLL